MARRYERTARLDCGAAYVVADWRIINCSTLPTRCECVDDPSRLWSALPSSVASRSVDDQSWISGIILNPRVSFNARQRVEPTAARTWSCKLAMIFVR